MSFFAYNPPKTHQKRYETKILINLDISNIFLTKNLHFENFQTLNFWKLNFRCVITDDVIISKQRLKSKKNLKFVEQYQLKVVSGCNDGITWDGPNRPLPSYYYLKEPISFRDKQKINSRSESIHLSTVRLYKTCLITFIE